MAIQKRNSIMRGTSGTVNGEVVFRQRFGKTVICKLPRPYPPKTDTQIANQERFKRANDFAKAAIKDPVKKAYYQSIAKPTQTAFNAAFQDAYHKPEVKVVVKEKITIKVKSKHAITKVMVGTGKAVLNNGQWEYKRIQAPFKVIVHDIAGNICTQEIKI